MFTQFLHPQLVLFGNFLDNKIGCKHDLQTKDGEIIVHQAIKRVWDGNFQFKASSRFNNEKNQDSPNRLDEQELHYLRNEEQYEQYSDDDDQEYEHNRLNGYYEADQNPYDDEYYGYNIEGQYLPQQLAGIFSNQTLKSPKKISKIPYSKEVPEKQQIKQIEANNVQQEGDWQTQQEEEDYAAIELLEEAGGNFTGDL